MQREEMELASERKRQSILRTELAWVMRGARARSTKQKARLERFEELKNTNKIILRSLQALLRHSLGIDDSEALKTAMLKLDDFFTE